VYRRRIFERVAYERNDDDYLFSFQIIAQTRAAGFTIGEVPVVCRYYPGATQISFRRAMAYGGGAAATLLRCLRARLGGYDPLFSPVPSVSGAERAGSVRTPR
jgi:hypothetical protein